MNGEENIKKLQKQLEIWLKKHDLEDGVKFLTTKEWIERGEDFHKTAEFVMIAAGSLGEIWEGYYGEGFYDEFVALVEDFGYYFEVGNAWNAGFYKIEDYKDVNFNATYNNKLKDSRWINKRVKILNRANGKCEDCGIEAKLEVHHCYYIYGIEPWQYPLDSLRGLCRKCHEERGGFEKIFRAKLADLKLEEIKAIEKIIDLGIYWYDRSKVFDFLSSFGYNDNIMKAKFDIVIESKKESSH